MIPHLAEFRVSTVRTFLNVLDICATLTGAAHEVVSKFGQAPNMEREELRHCAWDETTKRSGVCWCRAGRGITPVWSTDIAKTKRATGTEVYGLAASATPKPVLRTPSR